MVVKNKGQLYEEDINQLLDNKDLLPNELGENDSGFIYEFRVYCDNIIEGERFLFDILLDERINSKIIKEFGNPDTPIFIFDINNVRCTFFILTGIDWKRWNSTCLKELNESPDVFVTYLDGQNEKPIFGIEYCDAIKAGNQAWQQYSYFYQ